ncbi:tegument protein pp150 [Aotine betaherpesvirus 1]|uniref:Tegument protein pp150 n=1 Tax=Aotine betaherpesvirus 1 TaxID=50290 RepID=G8XUA7_9BETA|nr:tegument protein pp150 [Aotine betaherpesvirus 1]AEV80738.1 tegument protein pp150 [Aotine betaherpesvirus 1]
MSDLRFIGLPRRNVVTLVQFLKTLRQRDDVDLERHKKVFKKSGYRFLPRRTGLFNQLVLWMGYFRGLQKLRPDVSQPLAEFRRLCSSVSQYAVGHPEIDMGKVHVRAAVATLEREQKNAKDLDQETIKSVLEAATMLAKNVVYGKWITGGYDFVNLRRRDVIAIEENLNHAKSNFSKLEGLTVNLDSRRNPALVNECNKLTYVGRTMMTVMGSWEALESKCVRRINELCAALRSEFRGIGGFEAGYLGNLLRTRVRDGVSSNDLLLMLMEDFEMYEDAFPKPLGHGVFSLGAGVAESQAKAKYGDEWDEDGSRYLPVFPKPPDSGDLLDLKDPAVRRHVFDIEPLDDEEGFGYSQNRRHRDYTWDVQYGGDQDKPKRRGSSPKGASGSVEDLVDRLGDLDVKGGKKPMFVFEPPSIPMPSTVTPFSQALGSPSSDVTVLHDEQAKRSAGSGDGDQGDDEDDEVAEEEVEEEEEPDEGEDEEDGAGGGGDDGAPAPAAPVTPEEAAANIQKIVEAIKEDQLSP